MNKYNLLNKITWNFIMENNAPSVRSYLQSLSETLSNMRPSSTTDARRLELAKDHLREVKRHINKLEERVEMLEEQVKVLEEGRDLVEEE